MPYPFDLSHSLAFAQPSAPLIVTRISRGGIESYCSAQGLHEGDHVRRTPSAGHLLLEKPDGGIVVLPASYAFFIDAVPLAAAADGDESRGVRGPLGDESQYASEQRAVFR